MILLPLYFFTLSVLVSARSHRNDDDDRRNPVKLNTRQGLLMNQILGAYALKSSGELCKNHSDVFKTGLRAFEPWALQMFDSSSKLQAGILDGNLVDFGAFQQCLNIYHETGKFGTIRGKHCSIRALPTVGLLRTILEFRNISSKRFSRVYQFVSRATFVWTICVPDSCGPGDVIGHFGPIIAELTQGINLTVSADEDDCVTISGDKSLNKTELAIIACLGAFVVAVAAATIVDFASTTPDNNSFVRIFSARQNSIKIFAKKKSSEMDCVHGLRILSTCYVVIGHRYLMLMFFPVVNSLKIMDWVLFYRSTAITGGTLCVDTFFTLSGMLVAMGFFQEVAKSGRINWWLFYLYRYARITPPLAIVVLCYATLVHHLGSGPLWRDMLDILQKPCQEYWWAVILHIQNYVHPFPLCMTQVWYLTCDMQYYFLSPIILVPLWKCPTFGLINYSAIYVISVAINFYFAWINNYSGGVPVTNQLFSTKYFQHHYIAPHVRAATYIIGLGFGFYLHRAGGSRCYMGRPLALFGWIVALATMLAALVGCHAFHEENHDFNRLESSIYLSISRSAWSFGILWIIFACINGYGGPINWVLSSHIFRVLGRISYSIYLLHMLMQYLTSGASKTAGYFSDFGALYAASGDLFIMAIIGFAFTLCYESPIVGAFNLILEKDKKKVRPQA